MYKTRSEELWALVNTIKILNDDDALGLFRQILPAVQIFIQVHGSSVSLRCRVLASGRAPGKTRQIDHRLVFIMFVHRAENVGFVKVIALMVALLEGGAVG